MVYTVFSILILEKCRTMMRIMTMIVKIIVSLTPGLTARDIYANRKPNYAAMKIIATSSEDK